MENTYNNQQDKWKHTFDFDTVKNYFGHNYLAAYNTKDAIDIDKGEFAFIVHQLQKIGAVSCVLEVGCGPTIHHVIPMVPYAGEIHVADYLEENLDQIRLWQKGHPESHNWNDYTSMVLSLENKLADAQEVKQREDELREKITSITRCDLRSDLPLGKVKQYQLVGSFYTVEQISSHKTEWKEVMNRLCNLVDSGGYLLLSAIAESLFYSVHCQGKTKNIPVTYLTPNDFREVLEESGFNVKNATIEFRKIKGFEQEGFNGIILVAVQKY